MYAIRSYYAPLFSAEYCVAVRKGDDELLSLIERGLASIRSSGEYDAIYIVITSYSIHYTKLYENRTSR